MTLISIGDIYRDMGLLEDKIQWIVCPFCADEVSKLRPCNYWNDLGKEVKTHICVECAESVKGLFYLAQKVIIPGVEVAITTPDYISKLKFKFTLPKNDIAKVSYGSMSYRVSVKGSRLAVLRDGKSADQEKSYDNTFQVWFSLKSQLEKGDDIEETQTKVKKGKW